MADRERERRLAVNRARLAFVAEVRGGGEEPVPAQVLDAAEAVLSDLADMLTGGNDEPIGENGAEVRARIFAAEAALRGEG